MQSVFKSSDISQKLNISIPTIRRWVARFSAYFSAEATAPYRAHSLYNMDDFRVIATIHELSSTGYGLDAIEGKLAEGYRFEGSLEEVSSASPSLNDPKKNQPFEMMLDKLLQRNAELTNELNETKYQLGILQGKLDMLLQKN